MKTKKLILGVLTVLFIFGCSKDDEVFDITGIEEQKLETNDPVQGKFRTLIPIGDPLLPAPYCKYVQMKVTYHGGTGTITERRNRIFDIRNFYAYDTHMTSSGRCPSYLIPPKFSNPLTYIPESDTFVEIWKILKELSSAPCNGCPPSDEESKDISLDAETLGW